MENNKKVRGAVLKLVHLARKVRRDLEYEVEIPGYEEEDARIRIYCPLKYEQKIHRAIHDTWYKLLSEKDIFIGTSVYPPNHKHRKQAS